MTARTKSIIEEWGTWAFRGLLIGCLGLLYNEAKQIRRDVKTLMEERGAVQLRVGRVEKDVDRIETAQTNLWNSLMEHKLKEK